MFVLVDIPGPLQPEKKVGRKLVDLTKTNLAGDETLRGVAFRLVNKRREKDYNELAHNTTILDSVSVDQTMADFLSSMQ